MNNLSVLLNVLESKITKHELMDPAISNASVGWHIEHTLLTINLIVEALKRSDPGNYKWQFNFTRTLVLTIRKIPRGRAKSPKSVQPKINFTRETLQEHIGMAKRKLSELRPLKTNAYFEHPFFGKLNLKPAIKFLNIHTKHHIDIINDIIGN